MSLSPSLVLGHSQRDSWPVGTGRRATHQCPLAGPRPLGPDLSPSLSGRDATPSIAPLAPIAVAISISSAALDTRPCSLVSLSRHDPMACHVLRVSTQCFPSLNSSPLEHLQ